MPESIDINLSGVSPSTVHIHVTLTGHADEIIERLIALEAFMSDISAAVTGLADAYTSLADRVNTDVAHLEDLANQALAADTADQALIADLQAQIAAAAAAITSTTAQMNALDPMAPVVPPADTPPVA